VERRDFLKLAALMLGGFAVTDELVFEELFSNQTLGSQWTIANGYPDGRTKASNVWVDRYGKLHLQTKLDPNGQWYGADITLEAPYTFNKVVVRCKLEAAHATKGLALWWPASKVWPDDGEMDFMEIGGDLAWDRQTVACNVHYGSDNRIIHKKYAKDMTQMHAVECEWRADTFTFRCDGVEQQNILWGGGLTECPNPGLDTGHKLHLTYWPQHNSADDPWPDRNSQMVVDWVRIYA
jgi:hypothetical protein